MFLGSALWRPKGYFQFEITRNVSVSFEYLCYGPYKAIRISLILTDGPYTERVQLRIVVLKGLVIQVKVCDNSIGHGWVVTGTTLVIQISCLYGMFERFVLKFVQESPAIWRSISLTDLTWCGRQPERITSSENTWPSTDVSLTLSVRRSSESDDFRRQILTSKVDPALKE